MKTFSLVLLFMLAALVMAGAADSSVARAKTQSSFSLENNSRNPFWPIGWKPVAKITDNRAEHTGPDILPGTFAVTSITLDPGAHFAIINGKTMTEGQQFGLQLGTQTYQLTVKAIQDGRVVLMRRDQEIIVPLRRK
ncbi:MAG: hypothetical protein ABJB22_06685 [Verrucomicrobiota bacterium]